MQRLKSAKKEVMRHEMKLAARAARSQRQKELTDGVRTHKLGRIRYEEPSVDLKLRSEQVNCLRQLTVNLAFLPSVDNSHLGHIWVCFRCFYLRLVILLQIFRLCEKITN